MTSSVLTNAALHQNTTKEEDEKKPVISPDLLKQMYLYLRMNFTKQNSVAVEPKSTVISFVLS